MIYSCIGVDTYMTFEDFCAINNIIVTYQNFTTNIRGLCIKVDDYFIVAINPRFSYGSQKKTLQHEIMHIMKNHFFCDPSEVEQCEQEIDHIIKEFKLYFDDTIEAINW